MTDAVVGSGPARPTTPVDALAERYLKQHAELDPVMATYIGMSGYDARMPDLSPDGFRALDDLAAQTISELGSCTAADDVDKVTVLALTERLSLARELHAIGADLSDLKIIASPVQGLRDVFDLMPAETSEHWSTIATRM
jgi:hypothetical protein